jgi:hypothetical protein
MARKRTESYKTEKRQRKKHKSKVFFALREIEKKMLCAGSKDIRMLSVYQVLHPTIILMRCTKKK